MAQRIGKTAKAENYGFCPCGDGIQNAKALIKAISENETVTVNTPGIYDISGSVRLPSDTHLEFSKGVILRRVPLADKNLEGNLFVNEGAFDGKYNENITICGAHIAVNGVESAGASEESKNVIAGLRGHIAFLYIKNVKLSDILVADLEKKDYAVQISDFENAEVGNSHFEGLKDGIHFGPGKNFHVHDCTFRTYDDAIALNCADYSVSNPNFGTIRDGLIENCTELPGYDTYAFFIRILAGTARRWKKGMTVYHSDAVLTDTGMYRVVMKPDNTPYISETMPGFADGYKELDGIMWVKTHKGYTGEIPLTANCENITCKNITFLQSRRRGIYVYTSFDEYLRSYYKGSELPCVRNITLENMNVIKPVEYFLAANIPIANLKIKGGNISEKDILIEKNSQLD